MKGTSMDTRLAMLVLACVGILRGGLRPLPMTASVAAFSPIVTAIAHDRRPPSLVSPHSWLILKRQSIFHRTSSSHYALFSSSITDDVTDGSKSKARVVFLGTPDVAAASLRTIVQESKSEERFVQSLLLFNFGYKISPTASVYTHPTRLDALFLHWHPSMYVLNAILSLAL